MSKVPNVWADEKPARGAFPSLRIYIRNIQKALDERDALSRCAQLMVFALILVALFSRWPSVFIHAQFYAEDGMVWYAQAYNSGWVRSLLIPQAGYLQTLPRLGAGLALLVPLRYAPLAMTIIGAIIQVLPATILLSERCRTWAPLSTRVLLATVYVVLPNTKEVHVVLTNSQWHLALAGVLLAFAAPPKSWVGRSFDLLLFALGGFSGPFFIVLAPLLLAYSWFRRRSWSLAILAVMSIGVVAQTMVLVLGGLRVKRDLGANLDFFLRMVGGNIVAGSLFGSHGYPARAPMFLIVPAAFCWFAICLYCVRWANLELKLFIVYCAALLAASLRSPYVDFTKPGWEVLVGAVSHRYWFFPMLAFVWSLIWCARYAANRLVSIPSTALLLLMIIGIVSDRRYRPFDDEHFLQYARYVQDAPPGTHVTIPIVPDGWKMELIKRGNSL